MKKEKPDILNNELREHAPGIDNISKENPFKVPGNYFSKLLTNVQNIKNSRTERSYSTAFKYNLKKALVCATAFLIIIAGGMWYFLAYQQDNDIIAIVEDEDMLYESHFSYLADYDEIVYYEMLLAEDLSGIESYDIFYNFMSEEDILDEDPYFEYLVDYMDLYQYSPEYLAGIE